MRELLHSPRSNGMLWRRSPRSRHRLTDHRGCNVCTAESRSLSPRPVSREGRRSWGLRFSKGRTVGSKLLWSQPSTRIARRRNGRAPGRAPSVDQPQPPPSPTAALGRTDAVCDIAVIFYSFVRPEPRLPVRSIPPASLLRPLLSNRI